jgi:uroporphyrinogen-III synthase
MAGAEPALAGRVVLVARPAGRGEPLAGLLRALGAEVEIRPTIVLEPPEDPRPAALAARRCDAFDWVVFTSPSGVQFFFASPSIAALPSVAAIGPATARELERRGVACGVVARDSRAEGLAEALRASIVPGQRVLLVQPEVARPVLRRGIEELGAAVEAVAFYRNVAAAGAPAVARDVAAGRYDAIVLTSPSALERLLDAAADRAAVVAALRRARLVAIGGVTAAALERHGLAPAAVAREPSAEGIADAVVASFAGRA